MSLKKRATKVMMPFKRFNEGGQQQATQVVSSSPSPTTQPDHFAGPDVSSRVSTGRLVFILCLICVTGGLGFASHWYLTDAEEALGNQQFSSLADRALTSAQANTQRKLMATITLESIITGINGNVTAWPNITLRNYNEITGHLRATANGRGLAVGVFVQPHQAAAFEEYAYSYFESTADEWEEGVGISSFGRGIFSTDKSVNSSDCRYHDVTGETEWDSQHHLLAPIFFVNRPFHNLLIMRNYYNDESRGAWLDKLLDCTEQQQQQPQVVHPARNDSHASQQCNFILEPFVVYGQEEELGLGCTIMVPIQPDRQLHVATGFIISSIQWHEALGDSFPNEATGIDCVIKTETNVFSYSIVNGDVVYRGQRDIHDPSYTNYGRSVQLTPPELFSQQSAHYKLTLYPSHDFFHGYTTSNPRVATIGAVLIILFTSLLFLLYDCIVRAEFVRKEHLLEAKRRFMRFVSHEVRTPLNAIVMGMSILQDEVTDLLHRVKDSTGSVNNNNNKTMIETSPDASGSFGSTEDEIDVIDLSKQILVNAESAVQVLNDLLNYDKIEMGQLSYEPSIIPIWHIVHRTLMEFQAPVKAKNISYILDYTKLVGYDCRDKAREVIRAIPTELHELRLIGDKIRIVQVLRNLISNAIKFVPEGGAVEVSLSVETQTDSVTESDRIDDLRVVDSQSHKPFYFERGGFVHIDVKDSGAGLTEEQISKLFRHGVQFNVNDLQAGQGSGLGLYIAKGIVDKHRGKLSATSKGIGKGSVFSLVLPLHRIRDEDLPPGYDHLRMENNHCHSTANNSLGLMLPAPDLSLPDTESTSQASQHEHGTKAPQIQALPLPQTTTITTPEHRFCKNILVVDDSSSNRKLLARLLTRQGHRCIQACDGKEAVERVRDRLQKQVQGGEPKRSEEEDDDDDNGSAAALSAAEEGIIVEPHFDCILLDYEMPNMNGPEAAKQIRELGFASLIIGVTGNVLKEDVDYFVKCGANQVLAKPVKMGELQEIWANHITS